MDAADAAGAQVEVAHARGRDHDGRSRPAHSQPSRAARRPTARSTSSSRRRSSISPSSAAWPAPRSRRCPRIVYFHENQLVYPNRHTAEWDFQFPLTNITTALSAERCVFNTRWNLDRFCAEIPGFIREFPDHHPRGVAEAHRREVARARAAVRPRAVRCAPPTRGARCRIVWPHRWEHDKNPEEFFSAVMALAEEGLDFEVAVAGQSFRETEDLMRDAAEALGDRLVHCDEPASRAEYAALLASADVAVSTAINEFFGLAMVEACYAGATPLVPDRLAYPELYGREYRYAGADELVARLRGLILHRPAPLAARGLAERFTFERLVPDYEACSQRGRRGGRRFLGA